MSTSSLNDTPSRLTPLQWAICITAAIGFAFDSYVLLMLPLIVRPALVELLHVPATSPAINSWVGMLFNVPAVAGGIFGLLGGYLTDLFGRRRVLVWSILLYAVSGVRGGLLDDGVPAAVLALLHVRRRLRRVRRGRRLAGGALHEPEAARGGRRLHAGVRIARRRHGRPAAYYLVVTYADHLPLVRGTHDAWRYTLMSGIVPAIPLILIRPFLPESPGWREKKAAGTLKRPSFGELFRPEFRRTTIVTTIMMACAFGAAFGAIQQMPRIVPGLAEVRTLPRAGAGADRQRRAVVPGIRRPGRTPHARVPRGADSSAGAGCSTSSRFPA